MKPNIIDFINEQLAHAQENFIAQECQIADAWPEQLFFDNDRFLVNFSILGDDGNPYKLYILIDVEDESHQLVDESEFNDLSENNAFIDISNEIPEL